MSDPEKDVEIDDLLSSIRRLVADEDRHATITTTTESTPEDRLVLTPSLRVADEFDRSSDRNAPAEPRSPALGEAGSGPDDTPKDRTLVTLSSRIAVLEAAIAETDDQWEPDGSIGDDYAGTEVGTIEWQDDDDTGADAPDGPQIDAANTAQMAGQADIFAATDALMQSEILRELVAEIVRTELQGELGERITRNIRKLVRREIHRAMTLQELE